MVWRCWSSPNKCRYVATVDCYNLKPHLHKTHCYVPYFLVFDLLVVLFRSTNAVEIKRSISVDISKYQSLLEFQNELSKIKRFLKRLISVNISYYQSNSVEFHLLQSFVDKPTFNCQI